VLDVSPHPAQAAATDAIIFGGDTRFTLKL